MKSKKILLYGSLAILAVLALGAYATYLFPFLLKHSAAPPIVEGVPAPQFELKSLTGETYSLAQYKGTPVVLKFWSSI